MFVRFLTTAIPFNSVFDTSLASDFYDGVRCALLHEARTKNGWTIKFGNRATPVIDAQAKIIYRNNLQQNFDEFIEWYGKALLKDKSLQEAFLRKFDSLCWD